MMLFGSRQLGVLPEQQLGGTLLETCTALDVEIRRTEVSHGKIVVTFSSQC